MDQGPSVAISSDFVRMDPVDWEEITIENVLNIENQCWVFFGTSNFLREIFKIKWYKKECPNNYGAKQVKVNLQGGLLYKLSLMAAHFTSLLSYRVL